MKKIFFIVSVFLGTLLFSSQLILMTEIYPPYNFADSKGKPTGISVDIVREIIKKTGDVDNIKILPWARSYKYIQTKKNHVLFVMTRTPQREPLFKWVGPVAHNKWVFYAKKGSNIKLNTLDEAKKYRIGTYKDDACELFLKSKGFRVHSVPYDELNVKKLVRGRIDLWIVGEYQGYIKAKKLGLENKIKKVFDIKDTLLYIAFSKDVPDSIIDKWQKELNKLKKNGMYQKILDKYLFNKN